MSAVIVLASTASASDVWPVVRQVLLDSGQVALALSAIGALLWGVIRFAVLKPLDRRIAEATKQIQPNANGGQSLSDVNKKVDGLASAVDDLGKRLDRIEERSLEVYDHVLDMTRRMVSDHEKTTPTE